MGFSSRLEGNKRKSDVYKKTDPMWSDPFPPGLRKIIVYVN